MICRPFTLCLALLGLLSLPVFAAGTADDLLALHQMRLATQKSLTPSSCTSARKAINATPA